MISPLSTSIYFDPTDVNSAEAEPQVESDVTLRDDPDVLVRVEGLGKKFCRDLKKSLWYGMKDVMSELNPAKRRGTPESYVPSLRPDEFWANQGISFELRRGECLGLIGHNGAGKTTLLKMLNGLIKPDSGVIEMRGRVGALIALGAGFNPILTGRENIFVNGAILGLSQSQIKEKLDEIVEFSEIHEFIDTPVQSYSSGMQVRLGFAVATTLDPDVLILDEVLAVGDSAFRIKCLNRVAEMGKRAATIFVSHEALQVSRTCSRVIWLERGQVIEDTYDVEDVLNRYSKDLLESRSKNALATSTFKIPTVVNGNPVTPGEMLSLAANEPFVLEVEIPPLGIDEDVFLSILFLDASKNPVTEILDSSTHKLPRIDREQARSGTLLKLKIQGLLLPDGPYSARIAVKAASSIGGFLIRDENALSLMVSGLGKAWTRSFTRSEVVACGIAKREQ